MKFKKIFSMMMVGVVAFAAAVMMHGGNTWTEMTHWLVEHGYLEREEKGLQEHAVVEATVESRHMKLICEQSGIVIDLKQAVRSHIVNENMYRGSG